MSVAVAFESRPHLANKPMTFQEFAWQAVRMLLVDAGRIESMESPIPARFELDPKLETDVVIARERVHHVMQLTEEQCLKLAEEKYMAEIKEYNSARAELYERKERYFDLLDKLQRWEYPEGHGATRDLMVAQLDTARQLNDVEEKRRPEPVRMTAEQYSMHALQEALTEFHRCESRARSEVVQVRMANEWVDALRKDLGDPPPFPPVCSDAG